MLKNSLSRLFESEGLKQSMLTIIGNTVATGFSAISLILISRILGPSKFGEFSVGFAIVMIITRFNDAGLNATILKYAASSKNIKTQNAIFSLVLRYRFLISIIIMLLGILFTNKLAYLINFKNTQIIYLSFTIGLATVYYEQLLTMLQSFHLFGKAIFINAVQAIAKFFTAIIFLIFNWQAVLPIFSLYIFAPLVPTFFYKRLLPRTVKFQPLKTFPIEKKLILKMASHTSIAFVLAGIIENIDILFVQRYLNNYETGLLGGVSRIAMAFSLIAFSLSNVLNARVAKYKERSHLQSYFKKAWGLAGLALLGFILFIPFTKLSIFLTIGPAYLQGEGILNILVAASFLAIASVPFIALFYTLDSVWYFSSSGILQLIIVILGNAIFVPQYGLAAAAWTRLLARLSLFIFTVLIAIFSYRKKYVESSSQI